MTKSRRIQIAHIVGIAYLHFSCIYYFDYDSISIVTLLVLIFSYQIKILGITVGFHRYFSHGSFQVTNRFVLFVIALFGTFAGQGPLKRWVFHHRDHHKYSDQDKDPHSPVARSFYYAHIGWLFCEETFRDEKFEKYRLKLNPEIDFLDRYFITSFLIQIPILWLLGYLIIDDGATFIYWGFTLSTVLSLHATFLVNSLCHVFGTSENEVSDNSKNNLFVALLTNGEGWHNNHHAKPRSAIHGWKRRQIDISYLIICFMEKRGWVTDVTRPREL